MKTCKVCLVEKDDSSFRKNRINYEDRCKKCSYELNNSYKNLKIIPDFKICKKCLQDKEICMFRSILLKYGGVSFRGFCKECEIEVSINNNSKNPNTKLNNKTWTELNFDRRKIDLIKWRNENPEKIIKSNVIRHLSKQLHTTREEILKYPDLIRLQTTQILIKRKIR